MKRRIEQCLVCEKCFDHRGVFEIEDEDGDSIYWCCCCMEKQIKEKEVWRHEVIILDL